MKEKIEILENTVKDLSNSVSESKKVDQIEKVLHALTRKVLSLEDEFKVMKNKKTVERWLDAKVLVIDEISMIDKSFV